MTVAALPSTVSYIEDGVSTSFPVPFRFKAASDLVVERLRNSAVSTLALGVDYSVTGGGTDAGGTITRTAATSGAMLRISRRTARAQSMVYNPNDRFPAKSHEGALDQLMLIAQEQDAFGNRLNGRAIQVPDGELAGELPPAAARVGRALIGTPSGGFAAAPLGDGNDPTLRIDLASPDGASRVGVRATGFGAVPLSVDEPLLTRPTPEFWGARGDGVTDDTAAFEYAFAALPPGAELRLREGRTYRIRRTLVPRKPLRLQGGAREQCRILFAADGDYLSFGAGGAKAAMLFLHPNVTTVIGYDGKPILGANAIRSVASGITFEMEPGGPPNVSGLVLAAPVYLYELYVRSFTSNGVYVNAGADQLIGGNANGCSMINVTAQYNGGSGIAWSGNDANACFTLGCRSAENGAYGFFDDSLLGNTNVADEADNNKIGGYFSVKSKPNRSTWIGCYSETPTHFDLNSRNIILGTEGLVLGTRALGAAMLSGLASGDMFSSKALVIAEDENIANVNGGPSAPGRVMRVSEEGISWRPRPSGPAWQLSSVLTPGIVDMLYGADVPAIRFATSKVTGNFTAGRPLFPGGVVLGDSARAGFLGAGSGPPTSGDFERGGRWLNDAPVPGGFAGWICIESGSPGIWRPYERIEA